MSKIPHLKPDRVIRAIKRAGFEVKEGGKHTAVIKNVHFRVGPRQLIDIMNQSQKKEPDFKLSLAVSDVKISF